MIVAGIESSCDETAVSFVKDGRNVLSSLVSSQISVHQPFGGVIPEIAAREHLKSVSYLWEQAMKQSGLCESDIDLIAVTRGPGLAGALLVGVSFARGLSISLDRPLIGVDHVHAHIHGALLGLPPDTDIAELFPAIALVVSGGHTNLYWMEDPVRFRLLASTLDDACGECLDKVARMMDLGYPGGPVIEKMAEKGQRGRVSVPTMLPGKEYMAFSYSGLKTHMARLWEKNQGFQGQDLNDLILAFQDEAFGQIRRKTDLALEQLQKEDKYPRSVLVAGGVAANQSFRNIMSGFGNGVRTWFPALNYCSDNAAMIAALGCYEYQELQRSGKSLPDDADWDIYPRYLYS